MLFLIAHLSVVLLGNLINSPQSILGTENMAPAWRMQRRMVKTFFMS